MLYRLLADLILLAHLGFVLFVSLGGVLALWWPRVIWVHLPALAWGVIVELFRLRCPLTPFENWLRRAGGEQGYTGDFIEHYARHVLYAEITANVETALGVALLAGNVLVYGYAIRRWRKSVQTNALVSTPPN